MAYTLKQLTMAWTAVHNGLEPSSEVLSQLQLRTNPSFSDAEALGFVLNGADDSTALAALSYQFFTGKTPTKDGLAYLLNSPANPNDLNDAYYAGFNTENRYINFAANLGVQGEGAAAFAAKYGAMSFSDYVTSIYETIIGASYAQAAGIDIAKAIAYVVGTRDTLLATARGSGLITAGMTDAQIDLALKAAAAGVLMSEAVKSDVGLYAGSVNNLMLAMAQDNAAYGSNLVATYAPGAWTGASGTGSAITTAPSVLPGGPAPPEPEPDPVPVSQSFTLTTGTDTFTGGGANDSFTATIGTNATLNPGDVIDGAGGSDTLTLTNAGATTLAMAGLTIRNIERLPVTSTTADLTVDMTGATGFTEVRNVGSNRYVTFSGLTDTSTVLGVSGSVNATFFTFADAALAGNADVVTLSLNDATVAASTNLTATTAVANQFETLNIISNGTSNSPRLATGADQTSLATINISGAARLSLTFNSSTEKARTVATIDASASTGGVTIGASTTSLGVADQTIKLGSGDDTVFFGANLTSADTVDGGAGYDVLGLTAAINATALDNVTNVEAVKFTVAGAFTQNASYLGGRELQLEGTASSASINTLANDATVVVKNSLSNGTLSLTLANLGAGASDSLTLKLSASNIAGSRLSVLSNITDLETLNLVSEKFAGQTAANIITTDNVAAKHVLTGSGDLTITNIIVASIFDASAFTGNLTLRGPSASGVIKGGSGADIISLGAGDDTLDTGAGNDTIYIAPIGAVTHNVRGSDTIATGAGVDTIVLNDNNSAGTGDLVTYTGAPNVTDFVVGASAGATDRLAFVAADASYQLRPTGGSTVTGLAKGATSKGLGIGNTMVVQTAAQSGAAAAEANVSFIKLSTAVAFNTDLKTTFADAIGAASITGLAVNGNYAVSVYDTTHSKMLVAIVNVGGSGTGDTVLSSADFVATGVSLVATLDMTATDYDTFSALHLGVAI